MSVSTPFGSARVKADLVEKHAPFARSVAVKTVNGLPKDVGLDIDDAIQVGLEALCVAANRFDLDRHDPALGDLDTNFKSFAYLRIYGAVIDEARRNTFVKRRGLEKGMTAQMVSLDATLDYGDHDGPGLELVAISGDTDHVLDFGNAMRILSERERYVVLALASGAKGRELAAELGVTESRISQVNAEAKTKLNDYMEGVAA